MTLITSARMSFDKIQALKLLIMEARIPHLELSEVASSLLAHHPQAYNLLSIQELLLSLVELHPVGCFLHICEAVLLLHLAVPLATPPLLGLEVWDRQHILGLCWGKLLPLLYLLVDVILQVLVALYEILYIGD